MKFNISSVFGLVIGFVLVGALLSTALTGFTNFASTNVTIDSVETPISTANPTISTLVSTIIPILAVVALVFMFWKRDETD